MPLTQGHMPQIQDTRLTWGHMPHTGTHASDTGHTPQTQQTRCGHTGLSGERQSLAGSPGSTSPGPHPTRTGPSAAPLWLAAVSRSPGTLWLQQEPGGCHTCPGEDLGWPWISGWPPAALSHSPHRAMKIANTTVPSLSKRWVSCGEVGRRGWGRPPCASPPTPRGAPCRARASLPLL